MFLDRVTITGADDSIDPQDLIQLSKRFPFVEWGILLSRSQEGAARFPSTDWLLKLKGITDEHPLTLSGHLCGQWVRALMHGSNRFRYERPGVHDMFERVQLNFHGEPHDVYPLCAEALADWEREQYVFQVDGVNNSVMEELQVGSGLDFAPLFDLSGGAGVEPEEWPAPIAPYCGYAGGLHPDRLDAQLERIEVVAASSRIWIDVETHVRSDQDRLFDLAKVDKFLATAEKWVNEP